MAHQLKETPYLTQHPRRSSWQQRKPSIMAEAVDFEPEDDDLMDAGAGLIPSLRSAITGGESAFAGEFLAQARRTRGRGFQEEAEAERRSRMAVDDFESLRSDVGPGPQRSIEGWIILVTGVHKEAQEDDLHTAFGEFGEIKSLHLTPDRRTGFVKGYALIEYKNFTEAQAAISGLSGAEFLTETISVDWAFSNGPLRCRNMQRSLSYWGAKVIQLSGWAMCNMQILPPS